MFPLIARRLALGAPTVVLTTAVLFLAVGKLLGNPAAIMLGQDATAESIAAIDAKYGFDRPILTQYWNWITQALGGDLGQSYITQERVSDMIVRSLPVSLELAFWSFLLAIVVSIVFNTAPIARWLLTPLTIVLNVVGMSVPNFMLGITMIFLFAVELQWLPTTGWVDWSEGVGPHLRHLVLPVVTLAAYYYATFSIVYRAEYLSVQRRVFMTVARAKGLSEWTVAFKHAMPNAALPVVTLAGLSIGQAVGGAVVTETVFSMPGMGRLFVASIVGHDYPTMLAIGMISVSGVIIMNIAADILAGAINPLVRAR
jgi:peptide/nickel transport system permease protein